jgi:hypothetical protein
MDDKTINLWRQIEGCRRRAKAAGRAKPGGSPTRRTTSS